MADHNTVFPQRDARVPYGGSKGNSRKRTAQKEAQKRRVRKGGGKKLNRNLIYLIGIVVILCILFLFVRKNGTAVFIGEEQVGILESKKVTAEELITTLESQLASNVGSQVKLNEQITVEGVHIGSKNKKDVCTMEHLLPKMRNMVTYKVEAAIITVDGGKTAILANKETAEAVLQQVQEDLMPKKGVTKDMEVGWLEKVEIVSEFVESTEILQQEHAIDILESTTEATQSYTVKSGDALYLIASAFKTTVERLIELNTGTDLTKGIRVGQVINVPVQKPKVSVKTVETQVLTAVEPKTYETQYDDTKPSSYQKVIQQGKAGQKKSTIQITRVNDEVIEEKEVSKEIIQEAVPEIIMKGTQ